MLICKKLTVKLNDKDYYDKAVERFERHINQKQLF